MKMLSRIVIVTVCLFGFQLGIVADVIYQNDFSGTNIPPSFHTVVNDPTSPLVWSVDPSLQPDSGNPYARYDFTISSVSTNSRASWYGGFYAITSAGTSLPAQWQLSFDLQLNNAEPFRLGFEFVQGQSPFFQTTAAVYWVQPAGVGWQHVAVDQNTPFSIGQDFVFHPGQTGTYLTLALASHDASGNPLAISQVGTDNFSLDNILFQSVPEPGVASLCILVGGMLKVVRRYRRGRKVSLLPSCIPH